MLRSVVMFTNMCVYTMESMELKNGLCVYGLRTELSVGG